MVFFNLPLPYTALRCILANSFTWVPPGGRNNMTMHKSTHRNHPMVFTDKDKTAHPN